MAMDLVENARTARELCEKSLWPETLAFAQKWHAENPADAKALFYQGVALAALGRSLEAHTKYRRALELDATDFKTWNNLAALLFEKMKRPVEAIRCLDEALKIAPANPVGWANLASMNGQLGRDAQALASAERALTLDPQSAEALLHRARAAQKLGKTEIFQNATAALAALPPEQFRRIR